MAVMMVLLVMVQILSLAMMPTLYRGEVRIFQDPSSTSNVLYYLVLILTFTAFLLLAIRLGREKAVTAVIMISLALSIYYVLDAFLPLWPSLTLAATLTLALIFYPEWYVVDTVGLLVSAGVATLFGLSLTTLPTLLLLAVLAVYDAISVYKTRHMIALAEGAIKIRAPLLFVIPREKGYSYRLQGKDGKANFLGLGDAIIPTLLIISAGWSLPAPPILMGLNAPALGAMLGSWLGFLVMFISTKEKPQAGLPFLNGGAILGYLLACGLTGTPIF